MVDDQQAEQILVLAETMVDAHPFLQSERMVFSSSGSFAFMAADQEVSVDLWRALHDAEEALLHLNQSNGDILESNGAILHSARKENSDLNLATMRQEALYDDHDIQPKTLFGGEDILTTSIFDEQDKTAVAEDDLCQLPPELLSKLIEDSDSKVQLASSDNSSTISCNLSDPLALNLWDERLWLSSRTFHLPFPQEIALPAGKQTGALCMLCSLHQAFVLWSIRGSCCMCIAMLRASGWQPSALCCCFTINSSPKAFGCRGTTGFSFSMTS